MTVQGVRVGAEALGRRLSRGLAPGLNDFAELLQQ
jgi:hypothetical protein